MYLELSSEAVGLGMRCRLALKNITSLACCAVHAVQTGWFIHLFVDCLKEWISFICNFFFFEKSQKKNPKSFRSYFKEDQGESTCSNWIFLWFRWRFGQFWVWRIFWHFNLNILGFQRFFGISRDFLTNQKQNNLFVFFI